MWIDRLLTALYRASLLLYPRLFRLEFRAEMILVFEEALANARRLGIGAFIRFCLQEIISLPGSLFLAFQIVWFEQEGGMGNTKSVQPDIDHTWMRPPVSWGQVSLAVAPFILIWALENLANLVYLISLPSDSNFMQNFMVALTVLLVGCVTIAIVTAARKGWPLWSATWYLFIWILVFLPVGQFVSLALPEDSQLLLQEVFLYLLLPLAVATTLYRVTRADRLRGLLAALPILYVLWYPNFEQTPRHIIPASTEFWIKTFGMVLLVLAIVASLRLQDWRKGLWLVLSALAGIGLSFSYAGIYHGATLPYTAPGPSPIEVLKSFLPQYLAVGGILLGPFLARGLRDLGRRSGRAGLIGYRLALLSLLVVISSNLVGLEFGMNSFPGVPPINTEVFLRRLIIFGLFGYLIGLVLVFGDAVRAKARPDLAEIILLSILPLAIPLLFVLPFGSWKWPISNLYGIPLIWELPGSLILGLGLVWLFTSVWLVTRTKDKPAALHALPQAG